MDVFIETGLSMSQRWQESCLSLLKTLHSRRSAQVIGANLGTVQKGGLNQ